MSQQYQKIADYEGVLWADDSPVVLEKMRLCYDKVYGTNVLQITFRNVTELNMYGLSIRVTMKDEKGVPIYEQITYHYYGMEIATGRTFGAADDIIVEPEAAQFDIEVLRADLADGKYELPNALLKKMPEPRPLAELGEFEAPFTERLRELRPTVKPACAPDDKETYWRCVCKRIYPRRIDKCPQCRIKSQELLQIVPELRKEKRRRDMEAARLLREQQAAEEAARRAEEERLRKEEEERRLAEEQRLREEEERLAREAEEKRLKRERLKKQLKAIAVVCLVFVLSIYGYDRYRSSGNDIEEAPKVEEPVEPVEDIAPAPQKKVWPITVIKGADMTEEEKTILWRLYAVVEEALPDPDTIVVDASVHDVLGDFVDSEAMEERPISSVLIFPTEEGSGLDITMYNITHFTENNFREVFAAIELEDAKVVIASPTAASGSGAVAGLITLYEGELPTGQGIGVAKAIYSMNVRGGASTNYPIYGVTKAGMEVEVLEVLENGWYKIVWADAPEGFAYTSNYDNMYYTFKAR